MLLIGIEHKFSITIEQIGMDYHHKTVCPHFSFGKRISDTFAQIIVEKMQFFLFSIYELVHSIFFNHSMKYHLL